MRNFLRPLIFLAIFIAGIENTIYAQLPGYVPTSGLIAYYGFNSNANDLSGNGNTGTVSGPTYIADRFGNANAALNYTGTAERVTTHKIDRTTTNSFSYSVWVNPSVAIATMPPEGVGGGVSTVSSYSCIIAPVNGWNWSVASPATDVGAGLNVGTNGVYVTEHGPSVTNIQLSWTGTLTGWHHIVIVYTSQLPALYVDGAFVYTGILSTKIVHPSIACDSFLLAGGYPYITAGFGHGLYPITVPAYNFTGEIDDIAIYNRALTPCEISQLYDTIVSTIAITGNTPLCAGSTITLSTGSPGGTWTSTSTGVATIGSSSGIVTGVTGGTSNVTFTLPSGCKATATVTVVPIPAITGTESVCNGGATTLGYSTTGGVWSISPGSSAIATVGSSSGTVTGLAAGTATISYTVTLPGCGIAYPTALVTVNPNPSIIAGGPAACITIPLTLSDTLTGGTWSSGSTGVATIGSTSGVVNGILPGSTLITYTMPTGCFAATTVSVGPLPPVITGPTHVCIGSTITLSDATSGGAWSSGSGSIATIGSTGIVSGVAIGPATIAYSLNGCPTTYSITVNPIPSFIIGPSSLCVGSATTFTDGITGGSWSSSNTLVATTGPSPGTITGAAPGTTFLTYTLPTGCSAATTLIVNSLPSAITGPASICVGSATILTDSTIGGTWSSSDTLIAKIGSATGAVTGRYEGIVTITYTLLSSGCTATLTITDNPSPSVIVGASAMCSGSINYFGDITTGGTWSSSSTSVATVDSITGAVTGVAGGTAVISYSVPPGCSASDTVTVNPTPGAITGSTGICVGLTTTLSDPLSGGSWSSDNTLIATVNATTGVVTGINAGTAGITYTMLFTGCYAATIVTVNTSPGLITGSLQVCVGSTTALGDPAGGGTWSSSNHTVATIGASSGIVSGLVSPGTTVITYSLGAGCSTTAVVTVNPLPSLITGTASVCAGATTTLIDGGGGTWSSSNTTVATAGPAPGAVTGATPGTSVITYTLPTGCTTTKTVTVNPLPSAISGTLTLCPGTTTALSSPGTPGGTWTSGSTTIATVGSVSGTVYGVAPGNSLITYTISTGCTRSATVTVNPLPPVPTAVGGGTLSVCAGAAITLTDGTAGGTWATTSAIATVGSASGTVSGTSSGLVTITYTIGTGCARTAIVTVDPLPLSISGPTAVCADATITETDGTAGGNWTSGTTAVATIIPSGAGSGTVSGVAIGSSAIVYTLPTGCSTSTTVTVSLAPVTISGLSKVCNGDTTTLTDAVSGGAWSSAAGSGIATVGSSAGTVSGVSPGTVTISYSLGTGCTVTKIMTVSPSPAGISGPAGVCIGSTIALADITAGGVWGPPVIAGIASVSSTGGVTGTGAGTAAISYTVGSCSATTIVTVNPAPTVIGGAAAVCAQGATITLTDGVSGGIWSSSNTAAATAGTDGTITGVAGGATTITYSLGAGCIATKAITVNPISAITGASGICVGATATLSDLVTGGTWSSGSTGIATAGAAAGIVGGVAPGTSIITYTTAAGCAATKTVTVNLAPTAITGDQHVCVGATTALSDPASGGTWVSSNTSMATVINATGVVTGVAPGTSVITYSLGGGCTINGTVTVNPLPSPVMGVATVCAGATINLSDVTGGGSWSPASGSVATVSGSGTVTGVAAGITVITYTPGSGCFATKTITVNQLPGLIAGTANVCVGLTTTLSDTTSGGTWASPGSSSIATVGEATGVVGGVGAGTATVTYAMPTGCMTTVNVLVYSAPGPISGTLSMCTGATTILGDPTSGGTWSSPGGTGIIFTTPATGAVTGISVGTATVSYIVGGCPASAVVTVNSLPSAISAPGSGGVCSGAAIILSDPTPGGSWSSPAGAGVVIVDAATGSVTGEAPGIAVIDYSLGIGCTVSAPVTVNPLPAVPAVAGVGDNICAGYTTIVTDATTGGSWSCSPAAIATIIPVAPGTGIVTGAGGGIAVISYTVGTGCYATTTVSVTAVPQITGISHLCAYGDTGHVYDAMPGGTWSSALATVSASGLVTGYGAGMAGITYTVSSGCFAATAITIDPAPGPVTGTAKFCTGTTTTLSDTAAGGAWSPAVGSIATVSSIGVVTGVSAGTATISYALPGTGCMRTITVTVDPHPSAITGSSAVCAGQTMTLTDTIAGGLWSSPPFSAGIATIAPATGVVTGISAGTATITYSLSPGCTATRTIVVDPLPAVYALSGGGNYCSGTGGVDIGLTGAAAGISYDLYRGTSLAGSITGPVADFGLETLAGTYRVVATNTITSCAAAFPDSVTVTVTPSVVPAVSIAVSPANTVCAGTPVTFTATSVNGGTLPAYQWAVNSSVIPGASSSSYSYTPVNDDVVRTTLASNAACAIPATASDSVTMTVVTPVMPSVTINATPGTNVKPGQSVTLTATATGSGTLTYQWEINGNPVSGATNAVFTNSYNANDTVTCIVSAAGVCNTEGSNYVVIVVSNVGVAAPPPSTGSGQAGEVTVLPNPNNGEFIIRGSLGTTADEAVSLEITDMLGQAVYTDKVIAKDSKLNENIRLNNTIANGMYLLNVRSATGNKVFHIVIER